MSIMVAEIYKALIEAGASEASARAAASAIPIAKDLATKQDITDTKQDIADVKAELKQDIADVKAELKQDIADVKAELKQDIAELKQDIVVLKFAVFAFGPVILALLIKLVFFP